MFHTIIVVGNVGRDPEMRYTPSGQAVTSFSVASNRRYTSSNGEQVNETIWFRISAWGKQAEICNQYLKKGSLVYVEGRLQTDRYEDKSGETKYFTKVVASNVGPLDRKPAEEPVEEMSVAEEAAEYDA